MKRRISVFLIPILLCGFLYSEGRGEGPPEPMEPDYATKREVMVRRQLHERGITDWSVLGAMSSVPRHLFVPETERSKAYADRPLPIGYGQTISQPYVVALMTWLLDITPGDRILEVGTGSGYQAAVLAELADQVYSIEIIEALAESAKNTLSGAGYQQVHVRRGDGYYGWPEAAPFDGIIITAAAGHVPPPLIEQLAPGGRLVLPLGNPYQVQILTLVEKAADGDLRTNQLLPVRFVPMTGKMEGEGGP